MLLCPLSFGARATEPNSRASAPTAKDSIYGESGSHGILALLFFSRLGKKAAYHCIKKKSKSFTTPQLHVDCNLQSLQKMDARERPTHKLLLPF